MILTAVALLAAAATEPANVTPLGPLSVSITQTVAATCALALYRRISLAPAGDGGNGLPPGVSFSPPMEGRATGTGSCSSPGLDR